MLRTFTERQRHERFLCCSSNFSVTANNTKNWSEKRELIVKKFGWETMLKKFGTRHGCNFRAAEFMGFSM